MLGYRCVYTSGHSTFALKDDKERLEAIISCRTMKKLKFLPEEGMKVIAVGKFITYLGGITISNCY
ncbi:exodeoxyribonuclease VII large subunit [Bartonella gliris]|uniref:exodeoxyribonuclease VII large subunit n=1 Tax=Bartonella gliris TaxID=3004109 RepID=UPI0037BEF810